MKRTLLVSLGFALITPLAFTSNALANDLANDWVVGWSGEASLSGSRTTGNTNSTDIGIAISLEKQTGVWKSKFDTTYDFGTANAVNNKKRWLIGYQIDRQLNDQLYVYGNANYFSDDFGPFKQGSFVGAGLGFNVIKSEATKWELEAGTGYRSQKSRGTNLILPMRQNELAARSASNFSYQFNDAVSLFNNSELVWSNSDTYIWNDIGITAQVSGNLSARFNFRVDHHTSVPAGVSNTDTITRGALVYSLR